jgi:hypothetical protein
MSAPKPINPNLKFILGIFIMFCGWIICFDIFLLIIGIPFFLVGMILVFLSKKSILVKSITVAIPIILWFVGFEIILYEINKPTSITILIPQNYDGEFRIVEGEQNGVAPTEENGRITVTIPENGILITQAHLNLKESTDFEYYYVASNGNRTKLSSENGKENIKLPSVEFKGMTSPPNDSGQSNEAARKLDYLYDSFEVNSGIDVLIPTTDSFSNLELKLTQLTDSLIKIERGIK